MEYLHYSVRIPQFLEGTTQDSKVEKEKAAAVEESKKAEQVSANGNGAAVQDSSTQLHPVDMREKKKIEALYYQIDDKPPWYLTTFLGFQHYLTMVGGVVSVPFILCPKMCMMDDDPGRASIISTLIFVSGFVTLIQSTFGTRLPIIQGSSFSFIVPALAILSLPKWQCPADTEIAAMNEEDRTELWQTRIRELQGAIIIASLLEVFMGFFGIVGIILRFITPMTVAPAIALIGLSLFKVSALHASTNWGIAIATIILIIVFSQYLKNVKVPVPFTHSTKREGWLRYPFFQVFPVLLAMGIAWALCGILTATDALPADDKARTDAKWKIIDNSAWFIMPYPFQWGMPTITLGAVLGMTSAVIAGMVESIGDYYACARISGAPPPPTHAINRGIFVEGIGCVLAGMWGTGNGTTSFSENIGAISVTKVGARRVIQAAGIIMIACSLLGKVGAIFISIPEPIIGGVFCVVFATVTAVGLSNLQGVDLNSSRNIFVIGFSIFFGLTISQWMDGNSDLIKTGVESLDQLITILLSTGMFVAGALGFILDNTIPGTPEERGLHSWNVEKSDMEENATASRNKSYDLPLIMGFIRRVRWLRWLPISPTYEKFPKIPMNKCRRNNMPIAKEEQAPSDTPTN